MTSPSPGKPAHPLLYFALAAVVAILIAYGSLYPFVFRDAGTLNDDISLFLAGWELIPQSRGDFLANLLLYIPLGLAVALAFAQVMNRYLAAILALFCSASLSLCIELAQFFDVGRVSAFSDFALNAMGAFIGVVIAVLAGARLVQTAWPSGAAPAFARLLLLAWMGWRLYPYVPTMEIHKYWQSLKPVLFAQDVQAYDILRFAAIWLSVIFLLQTGVRLSMGFVLLAVFAFFAAKASIIGQVLTLQELAGAALALVLSPLVLGRFARFGVPFAAAALLVIVTLTRVLPWDFAEVSTPFQWIPFYGFMHGSETVNALSFAEKFFLYGTAILLMVRAGLKLPVAVGLECLVLFGTSLLQTQMVGRSAEISDAVLALIMGLIYAFLRRQHQEGNRRAPDLAQAAQAES